MRVPHLRSAGLCSAGPLALLAACAALVVCTGCQPDLDTEYGRRQGVPGEKSINGTAALAWMFQHAGHKINSRRDLSPKLAEEADVIVWFAQDPGVPDEKIIHWFEKWIAGGPDRTLVYVCRDYDAEPDYWNAVKSDAPEDQKEEIRRRIREAEEMQHAMAKLPDKLQHCPWFDLELPEKPRTADKLAGAWSEGVDPKKADIKLGNRLEPGEFEDEDAESYLTSGNDVLVHRQTVRGKGTLILVANGSFLLNYPLLNQENRKLAARLVGEFKKPRRVVFLEPGFLGPRILDDNAQPELPTALGLFAVWPLNLLLLHLAVLGMIFCLARWPIFGRPKAVASMPASDFGKHVDALGELLEIRGDQGYARSRIELYQQLQRSETTRKPASPATVTAGLSPGKR